MCRRWNTNVWRGQDLLCPPSIARGVCSFCSYGIRDPRIHKRVARSDDDNDMLIRVLKHIHNPNLSTWIPDYYAGRIWYHTPTDCTVKNPAQANAVCERLHQTVANALRPLIATCASTSEYQRCRLDHRYSAQHCHLFGKSSNTFNFKDLTRSSCISSRYDYRHTKYRRLTIITLLLQQRQALIDRNLMCANRKRISRDYQPSTEVMLLTYKPNRLQPRATGHALLIQYIQMER